MFCVLSKNYYVKNIFCKMEFQILVLKTVKVLGIPVCFFTHTTEKVFILVGIPIEKCV